MFSAQLQQQAQPILEEIFAHPFIQGISEGNVPDEAIKFYVQQDYQYLNEFIKIYSNAITKCRDRTMMKLFSDQITFILNDEVHPHHILCDVIGVTYESLQDATPAPMAYLYESHMYRAAETGSLLNIIAAFLPCPWTYAAIADYLSANGADNDANPFQAWIQFYMSLDNDQSLSMQLFSFIDQLAEQSTPNDLQIASQFFLKSCELEWQFWQQAFYQIDWHFKSVLDAALMPKEEH